MHGQKFDVGVRVLPFQLHSSHCPILTRALYGLYGAKIEETLPTPILGTWTQKSRKLWMSGGVRVRGVALERPASWCFFGPQVLNQA